MKAKSAKPEDLLETLWLLSGTMNDTVWRIRQLKEEIEFLQANVQDLAELLEKDESQVSKG